MISLDRLPPCTPAVVVALPRGRGLAQRLVALGIDPRSGRSGYSRSGDTAL